MPGKKIMIADDDVGIVDSISIMLEYAGYDVASTGDGSTLLELKENLPDLFLIDIWMSGVDGRDICKALKQAKSTSDLPVLMLSASREIERSAIEAGANDFLAKPFEMDELLDKIARLVA